MKNVRFFVATVLISIIFVFAIGAQQTPPVNKKTASLDNDDLLVPGTSSFTPSQNITGATITAVLDQAKSFRCSWISNSGEENNFEIAAEFSSPDRERVLTISGAPYESYEEGIIIGQDGFRRKKGSAIWLRASSPQNTKGTLRRYISDLLKNSHFKLEGNETIDGTSCFVYKLTGAPPEMKSEKTTNWTVWLQASDGLPIRFSGQSEAGKTVHQFSFSGYNSDIRIEAPIK